MTEWATNKRWGLITGVGLMVAILGIDAGLIWLATNRPMGIGTFIIGLAVLLSLGFLGLMGYWLYGLAFSGYSLDRNALIIHWGPTEQIIPAREIERVLTGDEIEGRIHFYGGLWPGHCVGYGDVPEAGTALFYSTVLPRQQIYIVTPGLTYGISPADHESFLESLHKRLQMGPTQIVEQSSRRPGILDWNIWQDWPGLALLAGGVLTTLALTALISFRFPNLPMLVPLHFDAAGNADRFGPRAQIFIIPLIGILSYLLNGVLGGLAYRREPMASYVLWGGSILIQVLAWAATLGILGQL